jgi:ankyrin repeat protein
MKTTPRRLVGENVGSKVAVVLMAAIAGLLLGCSPRLPVLNAAEQGDLAAVKKLLQEGHSINERNPRFKFGWTPLMAAIYHHNTNMVHYLIAAGADLNLHDTSGDTAIMWAIVHRDNGLDMVQDLIAHGADLSATNNMGVSVLSCAESMPPRPKVLEAVQAALARQRETK